MGKNNHFNAVRVEQQAREKQQEMENLVGDFFLEASSVETIDAFGQLLQEYVNNKENNVLDMQEILFDSFRTIKLIVRLEQINTRLQSYRGEQLDNEKFV